MTDTELREEIIELYEKFYRKLNGNPRYKFKTSEAREKQIASFIKGLHDNVQAVGTDFLRAFLNHVFGHYAGRENPWGGINTFPVTWILSVTFLKKFLKDGNRQKWGKKKGFKDEVLKVKEETGKSVSNSTKTKKELRDEKNHNEEIFSKVSSFEEKEKERFFNSAKGRIWCIDFTTLHDENSKFCSKCKFAENCKKMLKTEYPKIYKIRNERTS